MLSAICYVHLLINVPVCPTTRPYIEAQTCQNRGVYRTGLPGYLDLYCTYIAHFRVGYCSWSKSITISYILLILQQCHTLRRILLPYRYHIYITWHVVTFLFLDFFPRSILYILYISRVYYTPSYTLLSNIEWKIELKSLC